MKLGTLMRTGLVTAGLLALGTVNASAQTAPKSVIHVVTVSWKEDAKPEQIKAAYT